MRNGTYHIQVLICQLKETHHVVAVSSKVFQSIFPVRGSCELVCVFPPLRKELAFEIMSSSTFMERHNGKLTRYRLF